MQTKCEKEIIEHTRSILSQISAILIFQNVNDEIAFKMVSSILTNDSIEKFSKSKKK